VLAIEAWDGSPCAPVPRELEDDVSPLDGESGRGLFLIAMLGSGWGWYPTTIPAGKVTWCELQIPSGR
jgi:hypothetical protein